MKKTLSIILSITMIISIIGCSKENENGSNDVTNDMRSNAGGEFYQEPPAGEEPHYTPSPLHPDLFELKEAKDKETQILPDDMNSMNTIWLGEYDIAALASYKCYVLLKFISEETTYRAGDGSLDAVYKCKVIENYNGKELYTKYRYPEDRAFSILKKGDVIKVRLTKEDYTSIGRQIYYPEKGSYMFTHLGWYNDDRHLNAIKKNPGAAHLTEKDYKFMKGTFGLSNNKYTTVGFDKDMKIISKGAYYDGCKNIDEVVERYMEAQEYYWGLEDKRDG